MRKQSDGDNIYMEILTNLHVSSPEYEKWFLDVCIYIYILYWLLQLEWLDGFYSYSALRTLNEHRSLVK